ncbi:MAG: S1 family peptidase [Verrucomicrobiales bacterium]
MRIKYFEEGLEKETSFALSEGPVEWAVLLGGEPFGRGRSEDHEVLRSASRRPGDEVAEAIVVIEGDQGVGTGFLAAIGGKTYLYTAAHVLSGNSKLAVKLRNGQKILRFGRFEASSGADLVRIEVLEEVPAALLLGDTDGQSQQGKVIYAAGNSGGGGTVGFLEGKIQGVGAESIEIDAKVIQGNSGGPILDGVTHEVLGVVTHLVAARKDEWAKETRFSEIRRFGCRVDREWIWDEVPCGRFLVEGRQLKDLTDLNTLMVFALDPNEWRNPQLRGYEDHRIVKEIRELQSWIDNQRGRMTGVSESDRRKKVASFYTGLRTSSRQQMRDFRPGRFVWFHREMAEQVRLLREEIDEVCDEAIENLR